MTRAHTPSAVRRFARQNAGAMVLAALFLALSAASYPTRAQQPDPASPEASPAGPGTRGRGFVGQVQDSQAFIALQVAGPQVTVFVCDGTKTSISYWQWFSGQLNHGALDITAPDGEHLAAQLGENGATGTVTLGDKQPHHFQAAPARGAAGLLRSDFTIEGEAYEGGWIRQADGQTRGGIMDKKGKKKPLIIIIAILIG